MMCAIRLGEHIEENRLVGEKSMNVFFGEKKKILDKIPRIVFS